mmetsp:Transcript_3690/g.9793  ORF Transcript_3690/g.9793 Transcript_3690/m.9793 type:complete len:285 (-) Transcript_3690:603-1457(-)
MICLRVSLSKSSNARLSSCPSRSHTSSTTHNALNCTSLSVPREAAQSSAGCAATTGAAAAFSVLLRGVLGADPAALPPRLQQDAVLIRLRSRSLWPAPAPSLQRVSGSGSRFASSARRVTGSKTSFFSRCFRLAHGCSDAMAFATTASGVPLLPASRRAKKSENHSMASSSAMSSQSAHGSPSSRLLSGRHDSLGAALAFLAKTFCLKASTLLSTLPHGTRSVRLLAVDAAPPEQSGTRPSPKALAIGVGSSWKPGAASEMLWRRRSGLRLSSSCRPRGISLLW